MSDWSFQINSFTGFKTKILTNSTGEKITYWERNTPTKLIIKGSFSRPNFFVFLDNITIDLVTSNDKQISMYSKPLNLETDLGLSGEFTAEYDTFQGYPSSLNLEDKISKCLIKFYNKKGDLIGSLEQTLDYKIVDYVDVRCDGIVALNLQKTIDNTEKFKNTLKLKIKTPSSSSLMTGVSVDRVIVFVDDSWLDAEIKENSNGYITIDINTESLEAGAHNFAIACANSKNIEISYAEYSRVLYTKALSFEQGYVSLIQENTPYFNAAENDYNTRISFNYEYEDETSLSQQYLDGLVNGEYNFSVKLNTSIGQDTYIINFDFIDTLNIADNKFTCFLDNSTIVENWRNNTLEALFSNYINSLEVNNSGYVAINKIELLVYDEFGDIVISTKEHNSISDAIQIKKYPKWNGSSYEVISLYNSENNKINFNTTWPTLLQIGEEKKDTCSIIIKEAEDSQIEGLKVWGLKYFYRINEGDYEGDWREIGNSNSSELYFKLGIDDIRTQDTSNSGSVVVQISVLPYYTNTESEIIELDNFRTIGEEITIRYSINPTVSISENDLKNNSLPTFIFTKIGNFSDEESNNYNKLLLNEDELTDFTYAKGSITVFSIEENNYTVNTINIKQNEKFYPVTDDFSFASDAKYTIKISFKREVETETGIKDTEEIYSLNLEQFQIGNFLRPTFGMRQNGFIINGIAGASLPDDEFIQINCIDSKKGITFYSPEKDSDGNTVIARIWFKNGKIYLSGFELGNPPEETSTEETSTEEE